MSEKEYVVDAESGAGEHELVSIIVPTYNDTTYLERAIESIRAQTYSNVEIVLVDSSPEKAAREVIASDESVTYIHQRPQGVAAARNTGIDAANGEYVAFLDADDEWLPEKLERQIESLKSEGASFAFSQEYIKDGESKSLSRGIDLSEHRFHRDYFKAGTGIGSRTVVVRRECLRDHRFNEDLEAREDPHLWVRILQEYDAVKVNDPLAIKNVRADSLTSDAELVYRNERASINDLCDRYPELREYRSTRLWKAKYKCAKRQLELGERTEARQKLKELYNKSSDNRVAALIAVSYLPFGNGQAFDWLEKVHQQVIQ